VLVLYQELGDNRAQAEIFLRQLLPLEARIDGLDKVRAQGFVGGLLDLCIRNHGGLPYVYQHSRSPTKKTKAQMVLCGTPPLVAFSPTLSHARQSK
jgi:hypothetical protein